MNTFESLVSLNMFTDIGSIRLNKLLEYFGRPENILNASYEKLLAVSNIGPEIAKQICAFKKEDLDRELASSKELGLRIITLEDKDYPEILKKIPDPPIVLYIKGKITEEDRFSIAIVGSRRASIYGLTNAERFAFDLSKKGATIVSGMARGIDTYAHRGALKAGGRTIAVMGSGFKHIYPPENRGLAEKISSCGAAISEFPINTEPFRQNFPRRNRVISGLSLGVLVAEAARNSGALITADFALEQGRDVFALPGKVDSDNSLGTNGLIQQGAKLVSCVDDILEEYLYCINSSREQSLVKRKEDLSPDLCSKEEGNVYNLVSQQSIQLDELIEKTNMDISKISGILLKLQMRKLIKQLPGKLFVRSEQ